MGNIRSGNRIKKFFYTKTKPGRKIFDKALERAYGKLEKRLETGGYKFIYIKPSGSSFKTRHEFTTYLNENFQVTKKNAREFDPNTGKRISFYSEHIKPDGTTTISSNDNFKSVPETSYLKCREYNFYTSDNSGTREIMSSREVVAQYNHIEDTPDKKTLCFDIYEGTTEKSTQRIVKINNKS